VPDTSKTRGAQGRPYGDKVEKHITDLVTGGLAYAARAIFYLNMKDYRTAIHYLNRGAKSFSDACYEMDQVIEKAEAPKEGAT
jgi:hypothetical protein